MHAPLHVAGQDWHVNEERGRLVYQDEHGLLDLPAPRCPAGTSSTMPALAIAALRALGRIQGRRQRRSRPASSSAEWPARMQRLARARSCGAAGQRDLARRRPQCRGGRVVAAALADLEERVSRPLVLIVGMLATKDAGAFLANFAGLTRHIIAVPVPDREGAMPPERLADAARALGMRVESRRQRRGSLAFARAPGLRAAAAHPDHGLAVSRGPCACANGTPPG